MPAFTFSSKALKDVAELIAYQHRHKGAAHADRIESSLFHVFEAIGSSAEVGHRRPDLTTKNVLFDYSEPYFILFRRLKQRVQILRVVHKSRDLRKFL